jgi:hypothetical protein
MMIRERGVRKEGIAAQHIAIAVIVSFVLLWSHSTHESIGESEGDKAAVHADPAKHNLAQQKSGFQSFFLLRSIVSLSCFFQTLQCHWLNFVACTHSRHTIAATVRTLSKRNRGNEITALLLNWKTPLTLANTLKSYKKNGLFEFMNETVIFFQVRATNAMVQWCGLALFFR